jgi:Phage major capsid protein E
MQPNFLYGTYHLYGVFDRIEPDPFVFLDTFFRGAPILSPDDVVYFDEVPVDRRGATPFVHPRAESPTLRAQGYETAGTRPGYVKERIEMTPDRAFKRLYGERFGGSLTPMQRLQILLARDMDRLKSRWRRRLELMAAEVVKTGKLTIKGEGINSVLDFKRDESLTVKLVGEDSWLNPKFPMNSFFEKEKAKVASLNRAKETPTIAWMDSEAYQLFIANEEVRSIIKDFRRDAEVRVRLTPGPQSFKDLVYKGNFGDVDIFVLNAAYDDGTPLIGKKKMLFHTGDIMGEKMFGAIHDLNAGLVATEVFLDSWEERNPASRYVELQSAPALVSFDPNRAEMVSVAEAA